METFVFGGRTPKDMQVSMGPRHYSRGNSTREICDRVKTIGFNGATTLQSWKLKFVRMFLVTMKEFQWGPRHYSRGNMIQ